MDVRQLLEAVKKDEIDIDTAVNKLKDLTSDTETQIKILERSIEHSWKGIFPLPKEGETDGTNRNREPRQNTKTKKYNVELPEWKPTEGNAEGEEPF